MLAFDIVLSSATPLPIAEAVGGVGRALQASGCAVSIIEDRLPPVRADRVTLVLSPHEVYPHLEVSPAELERSLAHTILICTARPSAVGWDRSLRYATRARAVLDISDAGVTAFAAAGLSVRRFRIGYEPAIDFSVGGVATRPLDVVFLGTSTPRRQRLVAAAAPFLSRRNIDLRFTEGVASPANPVDGFVRGVQVPSAGPSEDLPQPPPSGRPALRMVASARGPREWLPSRLGALFRATPLDPGRHFVSVDHGHLRATLGRLLDEPERLEEIRATGATFFREHVRLADEVQTILEAAAHHPGRRRHAPSPADPLDAAPTVHPEGPTAADAVHAEILRQNAVLKRLFVGIRGLRREVAYVRHSVEDPGAPLVRTTTTPGWEASALREVSVIVGTLYNYGRCAGGGRERACLRRRRRRGDRDRRSLR